MTPKMVSYFETLLIGEQSLLEDNIRKQTSKQLAQCKKAIQAVSK
ncbi:MULTISPECIES: hypothetical protein [unclassified Colwellia]|nr:MULTISPECIES: hypothetical protein [unclassified Colwellia]